jgi:hypothetical protein
MIVSHGKCTWPCQAPNTPPPDNQSTIYVSFVFLPYTKATSVPRRRHANFSTLELTKVRERV